MLKQKSKQQILQVMIWLIGMISILLLGACAADAPSTAVPIATVAATTIPTTIPIATAAPVLQPQPLQAAGDEGPITLRYQGPAEMGSPDSSQCATLQLGITSEVTIIGCDGTTQSLALGEQSALEWQQLLARLAPFTYMTETEQITFEGSGDVAGEQWQRALLAWARARHAELSTGKTSATINTALSWYVGQDYTQKNVCTHLTVLDYGYAYADEFLCEGRDVISRTGDWLTNEELTQFDPWLYQRAPLYSDSNTIDGKGTQTMDEAEMAAVNGWAMDMWSRIKNSGKREVLGSTVNSCPDAQGDLGMVRDYRRGYCFLAPGTHTVFDTTPTEIAIVKDSLLNVTDPRLHIAVSAADGRSAEQFADEIVAEMAGFAIERSTAEVAGQPAVVLDNVPGQDINRRVLIVQNDRLYDLTFTPMGSAEMEAFYATIVTHFVLVTPEQ